MPTLAYVEKKKNEKKSVEMLKCLCFKLRLHNHFVAIIYLNRIIERTTAARSKVCNMENVREYENKRGNGTHILLLIVKTSFILYLLSVSFSFLFFYTFSIVLQNRICFCLRRNYDVKQRQRGKFNRKRNENYS